MSDSKSITIEMSTLDQIKTIFEMFKSGSLRLTWISAVNIQTRITLNIDVNSISSLEDGGQG